MKKIIGIDFDGTCVVDSFPISLKSVIEELPHELRKMNMIKHKG